MDDISPNFSISKKTSLKYEWEIKQAADVQARNFESPKFPTCAIDAPFALQWYLTMAIGANYHSFPVQLSLYGLSTNCSSVRASYTFAIRKTKNGEYVSKSSEMITIHPTTSKFSRFAKIGGFNDFTKLTSIEDLSTVFCIIDIEDEQEVNSIQIPSCNLWENFETLLTTGKNGDVTLAVNDQELKAHKNILMARSPIFDAMFSSQMTETIGSRVEIGDLDFEVLQEMVRFMYTGRAPNLPKMAAPLLIAADKYDLPMLLAMCEKEVFNKLSVENAGQTLILADRHHANQLKQLTLGFINRNARMVIDTDGWQEVVTAYPSVFGDVVRSLVMG